MAMLYGTTKRNEKNTESESEVREKAEIEEVERRMNSILEMQEYFKKEKNDMERTARLYRRQKYIIWECKKKITRRYCIYTTKE